MADIQCLEINAESGAAEICLTVTPGRSICVTFDQCPPVDSASLQLGTGANNAYYGDKGKIAYDHSQKPHAPSNAEKNVQSDWNEAGLLDDAFIKNKPTKLSQFENDPAYINCGQVPACEEDPVFNAWKTATPPMYPGGNLSDLINDTGFIDDITATEDPVWPISYLKFRRNGVIHDVTEIPKPDGLVSGGAVVWTGGLTFSVSAAAYYIGGELYTSGAGTAFVPNADPDDPRLDVIVLDSTGAIGVVVGIPAPNPAEPSINLSTQVKLSTVFLPAGAADIIVVPTDIYVTGGSWDDDARTLTLTRTGDLPDIVIQTNAMAKEDIIPVITNINGGYLYNGFVVTNIWPIAPTGWHIPSVTEWNTLRTNLGGTAVAGGKLKDDTVNIGFTDAQDNQYGFCARSSGRRNRITGEFTGSGIFAGWWASNGTSYYSISQGSEALSSTTGDDSYKLMGLSIRCIKDDANDPGAVTGLSGKVYPTVKIGDQVWMAANLAEEVFNNGIQTMPNPEMSDAIWAGTGSPMYCYYADVLTNAVTDDRLQIAHNLLNPIQGGKPGQRFHLDQTAYDRAMTPADDTHDGYLTKEDHALIGAGGSDELVKYNADDTTAGYLSDKIIAGDGISVAEGIGADENKLVITNSALSSYVESVTATPDGQWPISSLKYTKGGIDYDITEIPKPDGLLAGGRVSWVEGLIFDITAAIYYILGSLYTTLSSRVTLSSSDPVLNRIDAIIVDVNEVVSVIEGIPAANPQKPSIDPATQIELTYVLIPAGATVPDLDIGEELIYDENVEWTGSSSGVVVNFAYLINPYHGLTCIDVGTIGNNDTISFTSASLVDRTDFEDFIFNISLKGIMPNQHRLFIRFYNGTTPVSNEVQPVINKKFVIGYQNMSMKLSSFTWMSSSFDTIVFRYSRSSGDTTYVGFSLDYIKLQTSVTTVLPVNTGIELIGDVTGVGTTGSPLLTSLTILNPSPAGTYGGASAIPVVTVDTKGRVTAVSTESISTADEKVKYDAEDGTAGYLSAKIIAGTNITIEEGAGADENKLKISCTLISGPTGATGATGPTGATGATGPAGAGSSMSIVDHSTGAFTLALTDAGNYLTCNYASGFTVTVPKNSVVAFPIGTTICLEQTGNGAITMSPVDVDVTLVAYDGLTSYGQYAVLTLVKKGTDLWNVIAGTGF